MGTKRRSLILAIAAVSVLPALCFADSVAMPYPFVVASSNGRFFFKMIPAKWSARDGKDVLEREAHGVAYRVEQDGSFTELWKTSGWYAFELFLSNDGEHLVQMGHWAIGREPDERDSAVAFHRKGNRLKEYSTADLVKDHSAVIVTTSHYLWLARGKNMFSSKPIHDQEAELKLDWQNSFHLKTIDGILYEFDVTTGAIVKQQKP